MKNIKDISYCKFKYKAGVCTTLSARCRPLKNEESYEYESTVGEMLERDVFPVRYVNSGRNNLVSWDSPDAHPILFSDYVKNDTFMGILLDNWYKESLGQISETSLITLRCSECARIIIIDGMHRFSWLGSHEKYEAKVMVTELSGSHWDDRVPDLDVVCICSI